MYLSFIFLNSMRISRLNCGSLKVKATEMIKPLKEEEIASFYKVGQDGSMRLSMLALLVEEAERKVLIDPGAADFLPSGLRREYGLEMPVSLEQELNRVGLSPEEITDVIFTHLHFDHASGAFKRMPGNIVKRFENARYHLLREHYAYALDPDPREVGSFSTGLLKYLDRIFWLEDWDQAWMSFQVSNGHTRGMVIPVFENEGAQIYFMSDLVPMEIFLNVGLWCGYDMDPDLLIKEKTEILKAIDTGARLMLFHDTLKESVFYE